MTGLNGHEPINRSAGSRGSDTVTDVTPYERQLLAELAAIRRIDRALQAVDTETQQRIVRYLVDRYAPKPPITEATP
jgi:hypothetical protein